MFCFRIYVVFCFQYFLFGVPLSRDPLNFVKFACFGLFSWSREISPVFQIEKDLRQSLSTGTFLRGEHRQGEHLSSIYSCCFSNIFLTVRIIFYMYLPIECPIFFTWRSLTLRILVWLKEGLKLPNLFFLLMTPLTTPN